MSNYTKENYQQSYERLQIYSTH